MILICIIGQLYGDFDFDVINALSPLLLNFNYTIGSLNINISELLGLCLLLGGCIKSAQYGFHI